MSAYLNKNSCQSATANAKKLKEVGQWICWKFDGDIKKPASVLGGASASTWTKDYRTFEVAADAAEQIEHIEGPAFCLTKDDDFVGVDLDDCLDENLEPLDWCRPILEKFSSTYAEYSPSMTGLKIYCFGKKPDWMTCSVDCGSGKIETFEHGRYFAFTDAKFPGFASDVSDCQEAIEWLANEYYSKTNQPAPLSHQVPCESALARAVKYAVKFETQGQGGRNNQAFNLAGHMWAFGISESQVRMIVSDWNNRNSPPLPEKEIDAVIESARKNGTARADKSQPTPRHEVFASDVDLSKILESNSKPKEPEIEPMPRPIGLLDEIASFMDRTAMQRQPELAIAAAISTLGTLLGRKVRDELGNRTNLYCVGLAGTGQGKNAPRSRLLEILRGSHHTGFTDDVTSESALISLLKNDPSSVWCCDEFGKFLGHVIGNQRSTFMAQIGDAALKLYSLAGGLYTKNYADSKRNVKIDQPCLNIFGTSTPSTFFNALTSASTDDGFLPRLLVFEGQDQVEFNDDAVAEPVPDSIIKKTRKIQAYKPPSTGGDIEHTPTIIKRSSAAKERFIEFRNWCSKQDHNLWTRAAENACRLSLIHAVSRTCEIEGTSIEEVDMQWAVETSKSLTLGFIRQCERYLSDTEHEARQKEFLAFIKDRGPVTKTKLSKKFRKYDANERERVLCTLVDAGDIVAQAIETGGRMSTNYRAT